MSSFFRKTAVLFLVFQLFVTTPTGVVLAEELSNEVVPEILETVIEEVTVVDDAEVPLEESTVEEVVPSEDIPTDIPSEEVSEDTEEDDVSDEVVEEVPVSDDEASEVSEDDIEEGGDELPIDDHVQNDSIEQNVQNIDVLPELPPKLVLEDVLLLLEEAFISGSVKRDDRPGMIQFLQSTQVPEKIFQEVMSRFPVRNERELKKSTLPITQGIIPADLLKKPSKRLSPSGFQTESIDVSVPVEYVSDRVLVQVSSRSVADRWIAESEQKNVEVTVLQDEGQPLLRIDALDSSTTIDLLQRYVQDPEVVYQEPDYVYRTEAIPNDSLQSFQWHHFNNGGNYANFSGTAGEDIQSRDAWDIFNGNGNAIVAVIDTGVMHHHPDLQARMWDGSASCVDHNGAAIPGGCPHHGYDYFDLDTNPVDESNHGTMVAGSVAAHANNSVGAAGVNWNGKIMALKTGTADSTALAGSAIVNSIYFAVRNGADILNMSFSSSGESTSITNAINFARTNGVLVIAAAGNSSLNLDLPGQNAFPCETNLDNIVCVASTNLQGTLQFLGGSSTSNYGATSVDVAAPGSLILTPAPTQTDLYANAFENGASDVNQFILTGGSGWGLRDTGSNKMLTTHTADVYGNNESTFAEINQSFNLSGYESGTLIFEMSCATDNAFDGSGFPVDGVAVDISHDGGVNYQEVVSFNSSLTALRGQFDVGPNGLPLITVGLSEQDFVNQFRFRFHFFSNATTTGTGCNIDEVRLRVTSGGTYLYATGTSFAAPVTAGLASLLWEYDSSLNYQQIIQYILNGGESLPALTSTTISGKRINAYRSLALMTDPAAEMLLGYRFQGLVPFNSGDALNTDSLYFTWIAPTGQGIMSGYSYALDAAPDAAVDTTDLFLQLDALSEATHTLTVVGINDLGIQGTAQSITFTVDTTRPQDATNVSVNGGTNIVNISNVTSSSLVATSPEEVQYFDYHFVDSVLMAVSCPPYDCNLTYSNQVYTASSIDLSSLLDGSIRLSIQYIDFAGNYSSGTTPDVIVWKDTQISAPTLLQLNGAQPINAATAASVNLTFTASEAGSVVYTVSDADTDLTNTVVAMSGSNSISINHTSLEDGLLDISLVLTDAAGNPAAAVQTTLVKDTAVVSAAQVKLNNGVGVNGGNVSATTLSFEAFESGSADYLITDGSAPVVSGSVTVAGAGITSVPNLNLIGLDDGSLTVSVTFSDDVGNEAAETSVFVSKDSLVAAATNVQLHGGNTILAVNQSAVDLTFQTTEAGSATYTIADSGSGLISATVPVSAAGTTTVQDLNVTSLGDGMLSLSVVFTDLVQNTAAVGTGAVLKDSVVMVPTNVQLNGGVTISAALQSSVDLTFTTTEAGSASYTVSKDAGSISGVVSVMGTGMTTVDDLDVTSLGDGILSLSVIFTDTPGNISAAGIGSVEKDTQVNVATAVNVNSGAGVNALTATISTLRFTTDEVGNATYTISGAGALDVTGSVAAVNGVNAVSNLNLSAFTDGTLNLSVVFSDSVGNTAAAGIGSTEKDVLVDEAMDVQLNNGATINAATEASVDLTFSVTETGEVEYMISDGVNSLTDTETISTPGVVTIADLDVRSLVNGTLNLSVVFTDDLGNEAAAGLGSVIKDSDAPQAPQNVQLNGGVTINAATAGSVNVTGSVAEAGTLLYAIVDELNDDVNGSMVVSAGAFTIPGLDVSDLDDGTLTVYVTVTDASGNTSLDGNDSVEKDVVVQSAASVSLHGDVAINAASETDVDLTFTTTESGSAVYVVTDGLNIVTDTVIVTGAGTTTVEGIDVNTLDDDTLDISVVFTDDAGNAAVAGLSTVIKDALVPQAPQTIQLNGGVTILQSNQTSVDLTGTVGEAGMLAYVISDGTDDVTGTQAVSVGIFTVPGINVSSLDDEILSISVKVTDAAGNGSPEGTSSVSKDSQIAAVTNVQLHGGVTINATAQTSVSLTFTGTEAGSATYTISDGSAPNVSGSVAVSGAGTTTVSGLNVSTLDDGTLNLSVIFTDSAGNIASAATGSAQKDTQIAAPQNVELNNQVTINSATEDAVTLEGTVAEAGTLSYIISDGASNVSDSEAVASGNFSFSGINVSGLSDGTLSISVTLTDAAGNVSGVTQVGVLKDTFIADPTALVINGGQPITSAEETAVSFVFTVNEAGTLDYEFTDGTDTVTDSYVVVSSGVQTVSSVDVSSLAEGTLTLTVSFRDDAGNETGDVSDTVLKDSIANTPTNFVINGNQTINLANQSLVYFRAGFTETGTIDYEFTDTVNTVTGTGVISSVGVITISNIDLAGMNEGTITGNLTFTDDLGNISVTVVDTASKDTFVDSAAQVILNAGTTISNDSATAVTLSFVVNEIGTVNYVITDENNNMVTGTYIVSTVGTVVINGIDVSSLSNGLLVPSISFIDAAGNTAMTVQGAPIQKVDELPASSGGRRRSLTYSEAPVSGGGGGGSSPAPVSSSSGSVLSESVSRPDADEEVMDEEEVVEEEIVLPFVDLSEGDEEYEAVRYLYGRGIVRGQGDSARFDSEGVVDWAQALKILLLMSEQEVSSEVNESPFPDVEVSAWFAPYFSLAKKLGYVRGGPNGRVIPWQAMNRAEAVVLVYRILGIRPDEVDQSLMADVETGVWFSDALHDAVQQGFFSTREDGEDVYADPTALISRAEFVRLIVGAWKVSQE
jgi:subtilisin family serine protease